MSHYQQIWQTVAVIPAGRVASYGQVADLAGLPGRARLAGKALAITPPDMTLPWHRVLRSNGQLAFTPGSEQANQQKSLLQAEGVTVKGYRVKMADFAWKPDLTTLLFTLKY